MQQDPEILLIANVTLGIVDPSLLVILHSVRSESNVGGMNGFVTSMARNLTRIIRQTTIAQPLPVYFGTAHGEDLSVRVR